MDVRFDFKEVFDPDDYLYFYQSVLTPERLAAELDFLVKYTDLNCPKRILDLPCGHGRHANALAKMGHRVSGIDITAGFLDAARKDAQILGVDVEYMLGDMREIRFHETFDRVYALFTAVGYFDEEDNKKVFRNFYDALKPGGMLCFDSHNRDAFLSYLIPTQVSEKDGNMMIDQITFNTLSGRTKTRRTILRNNNLKTCEYSVQLYNPTELIRQLKEIGFCSCSFYGNWQGELLGNHSRRMIVVATK